MSRKSIVSLKDSGKDREPAPRGNKHVRIAGALREWVQSGDCPERLPKLVEMAERWDVAPLTMKKAVDALKGEGVLRVVRGQGIFPTRLKRRRTHVLGAVLHDSGIAPLHAQLIHGLSQAAAARGETMAVGRATMGREADEESEVRQLCERQGVDGIVLWPTEKGHGRRSAAVEYLMAEKIPFVLVPEPDLGIYRDCPSVSNVDSGAAADVMTHLIAGGHREIGFAQLESDVGQSVHLRHRRMQYEQSLRAAGYSRQLPILLPPHPAELSAPDLKRIIARLRGLRAVFCSTDHAAFALLHICLRAGIRVPDDLAVTGYDNHPMSRVIGLTTVEQHFGRIAEEAVALLIKEIEGEASGPVHRQVASELIVRSSSTPPEGLKRRR